MLRIKINEATQIGNTNYSLNQLVPYILYHSIVFSNLEQIRYEADTISGATITRNDNYGINLSAGSTPTGISGQFAYIYDVIGYK